MDYTPIVSSTISGAKFENGVLHIRFINGGEYMYFGVPQNIIDEFHNSESKGKYFAKYIKGQYAFQKITHKDMS